MKKYILFCFLLLLRESLPAQTNMLQTNENHSMLNAFKKYSYLLIEYPKQAVESDKDKGAIASGFFIRKSNKIYLITNYHVITGLDGWKKEFTDQYDSIKIRYFDQGNRARYHTIKLAEINKENKIVSFLEYPDIFVLEIKNMPKSAKIFSIEKIISASHTGASIDRIAFSFQYSLTPNNDLEQQVKNLKALDDLQANTKLYHPLICEDNKTFQAALKKVFTLNPDSISVHGGSQVFTIRDNTVIQSNWPQGLLVNSDHTNSFSQAGQTFILGTNTLIHSNLPQGLISYADSIGTLSGAQPFLPGNIIIQSSLQPGLLLNSDHSTSLPETGQNFIQGINLATFPAFLKGSNLLLDSTGTLSGTQPITIGGTTALQSKWPQGLQVNPDHIIRLSEVGQTFALETHTLDHPILIQGLGISVDSTGTLSGAQPFIFQGNTAIQSNWQPGILLNSDHFTSLPEAGQNFIQGGNIATYPAFFKGSTLLLDGTGTLSGTQPITIGDNTAFQSQWLQKLLANSDKTICLPEAGQAFIPEANTAIHSAFFQGSNLLLLDSTGALSAPHPFTIGNKTDFQSNWPKGALPNSNQIITFQEAQNLLSTPQQPLLNILGNNSSLQNQKLISPDINELMPQNSLHKSLHLSINDRLTFDQYPSTLYIGEIADPSYYRFYPAIFGSMNVLLKPKTYHGASGSPVFFKCTKIKNNRKSEWIEFAGVQSSINELLDLSIIVKAEQIINRINKEK